MKLKQIIDDLGMTPEQLKGGELKVSSPIDGETIAELKPHKPDHVAALVANAAQAFEQWKLVPAPKRGELIRVFGNKLRDKKVSLGQLVSIECGKIYQEGLGEVQEMIDICDFAVGLSRQLYGLTIVSERPSHKMQELWQPIGPVGIISAFNFPVAVWAWNAALAIICGNSVIWKPSEKTPVTALACQSLFEQACSEVGGIPKHLSQLLIGDAPVGEALVSNTAVPVVSATGSCAMGRKVGAMVAQRFGRSILELGGNNALIVAPTADLSLAVPAIVFGAVGTAGQRCTSTRRLLVHESIYDQLITAVTHAYASIPVGDPLQESNLVGPLIDQAAFDAMQQALALAKTLGGKVNGGERLLVNEEGTTSVLGAQAAFYVRPALVEMPESQQTVQTETFAPILYVYKYSELKQAIALQNDVPQGLSSAIFTNDVREAEYFTSAAGSDCGIANVNIGTSGAEIGGAFGGEKETGGGRESGSDAWKGYMRRMTSTTNYSSELPLAQGIKFDL